MAVSNRFSIRRQPANRLGPAAGQGLLLAPAGWRPPVTVVAAARRYG
jgi:hypothetical protein